MTEQEIRELIVELGASLFARGYCVGSAGNISVRLADGYLMTPTNSCLGRLRADRLSKLDKGWNHIGGDRPSKEVFMHRAVLGARPQAGAVVHLHSTYATAISCLSSPADTMPITPLTPYFVMRIGKHLPTIPYYRPGDPAMERKSTTPPKMPPPCCLPIMVRLFPAIPLWMPFMLPRNSKNPRAFPSCFRACPPES